ncbi:P-loop containing nucleoside triphosphate hydrolase protein [Flammula alnicola]|nr:P-loop containing nucleoside triphosphate hydrolase protein [Flammula alnicola]
MLTKDDPIMKDARNTDIVIPIMGPTGVGKSTFINTLLGGTVVTVGHELNSCTAKLEPVIVPSPPGTAGRLVIVDTPGFDDTYVDDSEILRRISVWLAASYSDSMKLGGVIYLHEITQVRMLGTTRRNIDVFMKLCGHNSLKSVILGTTKWDQGVTLAVGQQREKQLEDNYWKEMLNAGAQKFRIRNDKESAWNIINVIIDRYKKNNLDPKLGTKTPGDILQIQNELVNLQKIIPDTEAGKSLRYSLQEALDMQKKRAEKLKAQASTGDATLQEEYQNGQEQIRRTLGEISALRVTLPRRILTFFGGI